MTRPHRGGFSLLEVILATSILLASAIVLLELASIGRAHIESTEDLAAAQRICETRINEILAGVTPLSVVENQPLAEDPDWTITVELAPVEKLSSLASLRVSVAREASPGHRAKRYTLVRWIRNAQATPEGSPPSSAMPADGSVPASSPPSSSLFTPTASDAAPPSGKAPAPEATP